MLVERSIVAGSNSGLSDSGFLVKYEPIIIGLAALRVEDLDVFPTLK